MLGQGKYCWNAHSQVIPADIKKIGVFHQLPDFRGLQMLQLVVIGGCEIGDHGPVMASDHDTTAPRRVVLVDPVLGADSLAGAACFDELSGRRILSDAPNINGRSRREHVL